MDHGTKDAEVAGRYRAQQVRTIVAEDVPAALYDALTADAETLGIPPTESEIVTYALRFLHERAEGLRATAELRDWDAAHPDAAPAE